jgi:hypothetical protein
MERETLKNIFDFLKKEENKEHKDNGSYKVEIVF